MIRGFEVSIWGSLLGWVLSVLLSEFCLQSSTSILTLALLSSVSVLEYWSTAEGGVRYIFSHHRPNLPDC